MRFRKRPKASPRSRKSSGSVREAYRKNDRVQVSSHQRRRRVCRRRDRGGGPQDRAATIGTPGSVPVEPGSRRRSRGFGRGRESGPGGAECGTAIPGRGGAQGNHGLYPGDGGPAGSNDSHSAGLGQLGPGGGKPGTPRGHFEDSGFGAKRSGFLRGFAGSAASVQQPLRQHGPRRRRSRRVAEGNG